MPRRGYRLDRDGNQVPPWAPSRSTNIGTPTPPRGGFYDEVKERRMSPPCTGDQPAWFFKNTHDRITKVMPARTALDIMGITYKEQP